jgi:uncharacterized membrane protein HdeD (DUF308 family)
MARETSLTNAVSGLWWMGILEGVFAIFFGIVAVFWPDLTLVTLVYLLSAFIIALGLTETARGLMSINRRSTWWVTLLIGLIGLGVGLYLARHPHASFRTFILIVGISFIARGLLELVRVFVENWLTVGNRILGFIGGAVGIAAGIIILLQPVNGGLAFVWVLGLYGIIYGIMAITVSLDMRNEFEKLTGALR